MSQVNHKQFGTGAVVSSDKKTVTVNFNGELKNFVIAYANLTNIDGTNWKPSKQINPTSVPFTGKTDDQHFAGQIWWESHKEDMVTKSDMDVFIESQIAYRNGEW